MTASAKGKYCSTHLVGTIENKVESVEYRRNANGKFHHREMLADARPVIQHHCVSKGKKKRKSEIITAGQ